MRSKIIASTHNPRHRSHSRMDSPPIVTDDISILHRGHFKTDSSAGAGLTAAAPQCGQCRLPMGIIPKHDGHETVAIFDSQYWQSGEFEEIAAPQFGQFRVSAFI